LPDTRIAVGVDTGVLAPPPDTSADGGNQENDDDSFFIGSLPDLSRGGCKVDTGHVVVVKRGIWLSRARSRRVWASVTSIEFVTPA